jgi:hypothetical protein
MVRAEPTGIESSMYPVIKLSMCFRDHHQQEAPRARHGASIAGLFKYEKNVHGTREAFRLTNLAHCEILEKKLPYPETM